MDVPPHSLLLPAENDGTRRGFLKDGILYLTPVEGGSGAVRSGRLRGTVPIL